MPCLAFAEDGPIQNLSLRGQGTFRVGGLFSVYSAAYYEAGEAARLEVFYHRAFSAEQIISGGNALLRRNVTDEEWRSIQSSLEELNRSYRPVQSGDRYTLLRCPERGLGLSLNGEPPRWVACPQLAKVYFRIWMGEAPMSPRLRDELLGGASGDDAADAGKA